MDSDGIHKILSLTDVDNSPERPILDSDDKVSPKLNVKHILEKRNGFNTKFFKSDIMSSSNQSPKMNTCPKGNPMITHYFRDMKQTVKDYSKEEHRKGYYIDLFCDQIRSGQDLRELSKGKGLKIATPRADFLGYDIILDIDAMTKPIEDEDKSSSDEENSPEVTSDEENRSRTSSVPQGGIIKPVTKLFQPEELTYGFSSSSDEEGEKHPSAEKPLFDKISNVITTYPQIDKVVFVLDKSIPTARYMSISTYNNLYPDVSISFGQTNFKCQMHVLKNSSSYFAKRRTQRKFNLPNIGGIANIFKDIYNFMLTGRMKVSYRTILRVFIAGRFLEMDELIASVWRNLEMLVEGYEFGALMLYLDARKCKLEDVANALVSKIQILFLPFVSSGEFRRLTDCELCKLLSSNKIGVNSEMEVFYSMILWLEFDWKTRQKFVARLIKCIRFRLMDIEFFHRLENTNRNEVVHFVLDAARESKYHYDNVVYWTVRKMSENPQFNFPGSTKKHKKLEQPRLWIFNSGIEYHHRNNCPVHVPITYSRFKSHLSKILNYEITSSAEILTDRDAPCCRNVSEEDYKKNMYSSVYEKQEAVRKSMDKVRRQQTETETDQEVSYWNASDPLF